MEVRMIARRTNRYSVGMEIEGRWVEAKRFNDLHSARQFLIVLSDEVRRLAKKEIK